MRKNYESTTVFAFLIFIGFVPRSFGEDCARELHRMAENNVHLLYAISDDGKHVAQPAIDFRRDVAGNLSISRTPNDQSWVAGRIQIIRSTKDGRVVRAISQRQVDRKDQDPFTKPLGPYAKKLFEVPDDRHTQLKTPGTDRLGRVGATALSRAGKLLVSVEGPAKNWCELELETGKWGRPFAWQTNLGSWSQLSPAGLLPAASGYSAKCVHGWEIDLTPSGAEPCLLPIESTFRNEAAVSPDGRWILARYEKGIMLYSQRGQKITQVPCSIDVRHVALLSEQHACLFFTSGTIKVVDLDQGAIVQSIECPVGPPRLNQPAEAIELADNGRYIIFRAGDRQPHVVVFRNEEGTLSGPWLVRDPKTKRPLIARDVRIKAARFAPAAAISIAYSRDRSPARLLMVDLAKLVTETSAGMLSDPATARLRAAPKLQDPTRSIIPYTMTANEPVENESSSLVDIEALKNREPVVEIHTSTGKRDSLLHSVSDDGRYIAQPPTAFYRNLSGDVSLTPSDYRTTSNRFDDVAGMAQVIRGSDEGEITLVVSQPSFDAKPPSPFRKPLGPYAEELYNVSSERHLQLNPSPANQGAIGLTLFGRPGMLRFYFTANSRGSDRKTVIRDFDIINKKFDEQSIVEGQIPYQWRTHPRTYKSMVMPNSEGIILPKGGGIAGQFAPLGSKPAEMNLCLGKTIRPKSISLFPDGKTVLADYHEGLGLWNLNSGDQSTIPMDYPKRWLGALTEKRICVIHPVYSTTEKHHVSHHDLKLIDTASNTTIDSISIRDLRPKLSDRANELISVANDGEFICIPAHRASDVVMLVFQVQENKLEGPWPVADPQGDQYLVGVIDYHAARHAPVLAISTAHTEKTKGSNNEIQRLVRVNLKALTAMPPKGTEGGELALSNGK